MANLRRLSGVGDNEDSGEGTHVNGVSILPAPPEAFQRQNGYRTMPMPSDRAILAGNQEADEYKADSLEIDNNQPSVDKKKKAGKKKRIIAELSQYRLASDQLELLKIAIRNVEVKKAIEKTVDRAAQQIAQNAARKAAQQAKAISQINDGAKEESEVNRCKKGHLWAKCDCPVSFEDAQASNNNAVLMSNNPAGPTNLSGSTNSPRIPRSPPVEPVNNAQAAAKPEGEIGWLEYIGKGVAGIIAVGCGIAVAAAFISLSLISGGVLPYVIAGVLFGSSTLMNWLIYRNAIASVISDIKSGKLSKDHNGKPLSSGTKLFMGFGLLCALAVGAAQAVLTYSGTFTLTHAFTFLGVLSPIFPPLALFLASMMLIGLTVLMFRNISDLIKAPDFKGACKRFFLNLVDFKRDPILLVSATPPHADQLQKIVGDSAYILIGRDFYFFSKNAKEPPQKLKWKEGVDQAVVLNQLRDKNKLTPQDLTLIELNVVNHKIKSRKRIILERVLTLILTLVFFSLAGLGLAMTMNASAVGAQKLLLKIPAVSEAIVSAVSKFMCLGFALLGRIPFTLKNSALILRDLFGSRSFAKNREGWTFNSCWNGFVKMVKYIGCFINGIGNGLISMVGSGGAGHAQNWVIGAAGGYVSISAGITSGILGALRSEADSKEKGRGSKVAPTDKFLPDVPPSPPPSDNKLPPQGNVTLIAEVVVDKSSAPSTPTSEKRNLQNSKHPSTDVQQIRQVTFNQQQHIIPIDIINADLDQSGESDSAGIDVGLKRSMSTRAKSPVPRSVLQHTSSVKDLPMLHTPNREPRQRSGSFNEAQPKLVKPPSPTAEYSHDTNFYPAFRYPGPF